MQRRQFLIGSAALAWPLAVRAQRIPYIGFLNSGSPNERAAQIETFRRGLKEGGYVEGENVAIDYRWAEGQYERLPRLAAELAERKVALIIAWGTIGAAQAAKSATSTIPIVFVGGWDPVKAGLVSSLSRPGGNVTGVTNLGRSLDGKRVGLLHELIPSAPKIGYLVHPDVSDAESLIEAAQAAAGKTGRKLHVVTARNEHEIDSAFNELGRNSVKPLAVASEALFITRRDQIVELAARHGLIACYPFRDFVIAGGLMSYGPDGNENGRQSGLYAARILKGAKPADMPVIQQAKLELVVNMKTVKAQKINFSRDFLARADELIQ